MILAILAATMLMADSTTAMQTAPASAGAQPPAAAAPNRAKPKPAGNTLVCRNEPVLAAPADRCRTTEQMAAQKQEDQANREEVAGVRPRALSSAYRSSSQLWMSSTPLALSVFVNARDLPGIHLKTLAVITRKGGAERPRSPSTNAGREGGGAKAVRRRRPVAIGLRHREIE